MTAGYTELLTKQVALTGTETDLGALFGESTGKIRLSIPDAATSSVWLGSKGITTLTGGEYKAGTQTQLPTTSLRGWYAITDGASVTVTIEMATGGVDAPDWITAGTVGAGGGGGGGGDATAANQLVQIAAEQAIQVATESIDTKTPADPATDTAIANVVTAVDNVASVVATDGTAQSILAALGTPLQEGGNVVVTSAPGLTDTELRASPVPVSNATASQADGHSESIGATTDADTANTLIGLLKWIKARLPTALISNRLDMNIGSWFGATTPTVGQKANAASIPMTISSDQFLSGGLYVQGRSANNTAWSGVTNPLLMAGATSAGGGNVAVFLVDASGRQVVVGPGASTAATSVSTVDAIATTKTVGPISAAASGTLKASAGRLRSFRVEGVSNGTYYLQIHDAASTGAISAGTIKGLGYEIGGSGDEFVVQFAAPISFTTGISWAISSTKNTYTASVSTAFVEGIWE